MFDTKNLKQIVNENLNGTGLTEPLESIKANKGKQIKSEEPNDATEEQKDPFIEPMDSTPPTVQQAEIVNHVVENLHPALIKEPTWALKDMDNCRDMEKKMEFFNENNN